MLMDILQQVSQEDDDQFDFPLIFLATKALEEVKEPRISISKLAYVLCLLLYTL
jgi:hypothetical protein